MNEIKEKRKNEKKRKGTRTGRHSGREERDYDGKWERND